jgi:hypothetical protein
VSVDTLKNGLSNPAGHTKLKAIRSPSVGPAEESEQTSAKRFVAFQHEGKRILEGECRLLGCGAIGVYCKQTFRRSMSPPSSGKEK